MTIRHIENSKLAKFLNYNITLYPFIFYIGVPREDVRVHEMTHVQQIERVGWVRFYLSYLAYYLAGRIAGKKQMQAYYEIPYEVDAYKVQADFNRNR